MKVENAGDMKLLERALEGDETAFGALYRRWQQGIYRFALRLSGSESSAEDITQEVFLTLIKGGSGFDPALGSFSAYIYGIARNHALRRLSRERVFEPIQDSFDDTERVACNPLSPGADPLGNLTRRETVESLHRAIAALPLHYREILILCELHQLSYAEAAQVVGCPEGTVRSRLMRRCSQWKAGSWFAYCCQGVLSRPADCR